METSMMSVEDSSQGCNVQVAVRCRPLSEDEEKRGAQPVVSTDTETKKIKVGYGQGVKKVTKSFTYDKVFGRFATQDDIFNSTVSSVVSEVLEGFSCTVFAYGQTGTGKTYTMEGCLDAPAKWGVIPRSIQMVFEKLESSGADFTARVSYLEIYQEELQDLLDPTPVAGPGKSAAGAGSKKLRLCEDVKKGVQILGLEEVACTSPEDMIALLKRGVQNRATAETLCNQKSSRSHSLFTLKIVIKETTPAGEDVIKHGQLNLVDLAGSECVGRSGAKNERAREAGNINQSLLTLGRVITALVDGQSHIPYRDSKLTRLLQESLGGRAKTLIIATVSPVSGNIDETLSTLDYAFRAKNIKNRPEVNARQTSRTLIKEYNMEIETLKAMLQATRDKNGVYLPPAEFDQMQSTLGAQADRIKESEQAIRMRSQELQELRQAKTKLTGQLETAQETLTQTEADLVLSREEGERLRSELKETKGQLAGTKAIVMAHTKTEEELRGQATLLQSSLEKAHCDVQGLFAKIERLIKALEPRSEAARVLATDCGSELQQANRGIDALSTTGIKAAKVLQDALTRLVQEEGKEMGEAIETFVGEVDVMVQEGGAAAGRVGKEMCARLTKELVDVLVQESQAQSQAMLQRAQAYQEGSTASSAAVKRAFAETVTEMQSTLQGLAQQAERSRKMLETMSTEQKEMTLKSKETLQALVTETEKRSRADEEALKTHLDEQRMNLQRQVEQMMATYEAANGALLKTAVQSNIGHRRLVTRMQQGVASLLDSSSTNMEDGCQAVSTQELDPLCSSAAAATSSLVEKHKPAHDRAIGGVETDAAGLVSKLEEATSAGDKKMQETLEAGAEVIQSIEAETKKIGALLEGKGVDVSNAMKAAGQASSQRLASHSNNFVHLVKSTLSEPLAQGVSTVKATITRSEDMVVLYGKTASRSEQPTQTTPQKRSYPAPEQPFSSTRPHDEIMAQALIHFERRENREIDSSEDDDMVSTAAVLGSEVRGEEAAALSSSSQEGGAHQQEGGGRGDEAENVPSPTKKARFAATSTADMDVVVSGADENVSVASEVGQKPAAAAEPPNKTNTKRGTAAATSNKTTSTRSRIPRPGAKALGQVKNSDMNSGR